MLKKIIANQKIGTIDYKFGIALLILVIFGIATLSSASAPLSYTRFGDSYYYLKHQLVLGLLPGIIFFTLFSLIDYRFWKKWAPTMLAASLVLLVLVFIPGLKAEYGNAKSWINVFGYSLQPSEVVKLTFLIYLAAWLDNRGSHKAGDFHEGLIPFLIALGLIMILMVLQPDIGTMNIIVFMSIAVFFVGGGKFNHILMIGIGGLAFIALLIVSSPYRTDRFMTFLHPELDPQGIGYHINQAWLALGSGGLVGQGFGMSQQKYQYLPEVMGDSIFAVIGEELGFIALVICIGLYLYIIKRGLMIAQKTNDQFGRLLVTGVMAWFAFQTFVNMGAMVGLLPLTGVPLPLISYGGTSITVTMAAMGLVANVSRKIKTDE